MTPNVLLLSIFQNVYENILGNLFGEVLPDVLPDAFPNVFLDALVIVFVNISRTTIFGNLDFKSKSHIEANIQFLSRIVILH